MAAGDQSAARLDFDPATLGPFTSGEPYLGRYETGLYPGAHRGTVGHESGRRRTGAPRPRGSGWVTLAGYIRQATGNGTLLVDHLTTAARSRSSRERRYTLPGAG